MKRKISVILVLLLVFSLSASAYGAEASISSGISDLNAKITKAQSELAVFESKNSALTSTSELVFGTVISTDPFIVLGMGMGINSFIMPTNYYYIEDPQNGKVSNGVTYTGVHKFIEGGNIKAVPVIKDGRTLVSIAAISDALGGIPEWNRSINFFL